MNAVSETRDLIRTVASQHVRLPGEAPFGLHSYLFASSVLTNIVKRRFRSDYVEYRTINKYFAIVFAQGLCLATESNASLRDLVRCTIRPNDPNSELPLQLAQALVSEMKDSYAESNVVRPVHLGALQARTAWSIVSLGEFISVKSPSDSRAYRVPVDDELRRLEGLGAFHLNMAFVTIREAPDLIRDTVNLLNPLTGDGDDSVIDDSEDPKAVAALAHTWARQWAKMFRTDLLPVVQ